ncbi:hypothetical protein CEW89_07185 [Celeribacter ethanolicus]|uniref:Uncharacterized protein n=2 Tax=Celeribacter ethanolicus TaxID=1758178 RepID=A0A291GBE6_9RHOB|nr:hypothetical protein CEW89_07185 [Celeribacter ethanolicus]
MNFTTDKPFSWKDPYPTPEDLAAFLWQVNPDASDLDVLIEFAGFHRQAYDTLLEVAKAHRATLTDAQKLRMFDALMRDPPRRGKPNTSYD